MISLRFVLKVGVALITVAKASAQNESPTDLYREFRLKIVSTDLMTRKFFEDRDAPIPDNAEQENRSRWVLNVAENQARADYVIGEGRTSTPYVQLFDGSKMLEYHVAKNPTGKRKLIRATEEDKNRILSPIWSALKRDVDTLRFKQEDPPRSAQARIRNGEILIADDVTGRRLTRFDAKAPYEYLGETSSNPSGSVVSKIVVTTRFPDGFPKEILFTTRDRGELVAKTTYSIVERLSGPVDEKLFRVSMAAGSMISRNDEGWIYSVNEDGFRSKFAPITTGKPVGIIGRIGVFLVGGTGLLLATLLFLLYRRARGRDSTF